MIRRYSGIYTITNLVDGKMYVGKATDVLKRKNCHFSTLRNQNHVNTHLQRAFNKYGEENFVFELIEEHPVEFLDAMECFWINMLSVTNREYGYNLTFGNPNGVSYMPKESIQKGIESRKGYTHSEETRKKLSLAAKGKTRSPHSEETKLKMSIANHNRVVESKYIHIQMDKQLNIINSFYTLQELRSAGFNYNPVFAASTKVRKTYRGFIWERILKEK